MSGGHWDYIQYRFTDVSEDIEKLIEKNGQPKSEEELKEERWHDSGWFDKYPEDKFHYKYPEEVIEEFKKLLADKTHSDNQTTSYHNNVKSILTRMLTTADDLDKVVPGEGIFGLIILSLRSSLKMKDELVKTEVKIRELERELKKLKR